MVLKLENASEVHLRGGISKCSPVFAGNNLIKVCEDGIRISIVDQTNGPKNECILLGHEKPIITMAISYNNSILCSCSEEKIILWDIMPTIHLSKDVSLSHVSKGVVVGEKIGFVSHCSISWTLKWLALCQSNDIWIVLLRENIFESETDDGFRLHTILNSDSNQVNMCSFSSQLLDILITVEDSNHFKVWDLLTNNILYRSTNLVNNYITCCSFGGLPSKLLIGTSKGLIQVYSFNDKCMPSSCMTFTISEKNFVYELENNAGKGAIYPKVRDQAKQEDIYSPKKECVIFSLHMYNQKVTSDEVEEYGMLDIVEKMLESITSLGSVLVTCCNFGIILHSCKSHECIGCVSFSDLKVMQNLPHAQFHLIEYIIWHGDSLNDIQCWIKTSFSQQKLFLLKLVFEKSGDNLPCCDLSVDENDQYLSFLSSSSINEKSPLLYVIKLDEKSMYSSDQLKVNICHNVKIKSSGYGKCPRTKMFSPVTNVNKNAKVPAKSDNSQGIHHIKCSYHQKNVLDHGPPENNDRKILVCKTSGIAIKLVYTANGDHIACNSASSQICILPKNTSQMDKSINISGHDSSVTSLNFNLSSKWLLSSSSDSTVRVWNWRNRKCILKIETMARSMFDIKPGHSINPVTQARFFYLDKFILLATKDQIDLYSHLLFKENAGIHRSAEGKGSHKVKSIFFPAQYVTCFTAANQFHSYLVAGGCSNRDIMVYDLNIQKFVGAIKESHTQRPPHSLVQLTGSTCPSIPALAPGAYNLFLSAAISDGVKLWDLRTLRCVQKYNRHLNRAYTSGIDFSPCGRFVAACSEDKRVYIYDTRDCENALYRLGGFSDVVMDVAFSPCMTQLAASSLNGHILTFRPRL